MKVNLRRGKVQITLTDAEVSGELRDLLQVIAWDRERSALGWTCRNEAMVELYARLAAIVDGHGSNGDSCMSVVWRDDAVRMGEVYTAAYEAMTSGMSTMRRDSRASFDLKRRTKRERASSAKARQRAILLRALEPGLHKLDAPDAPTGTDG